MAYPADSLALSLRNSDGLGSTPQWAIYISTKIFDWFVDIYLHGKNM